MNQPPEQIALFHVHHRERVAENRAPEPSVSEPSASTPDFDPHSGQLAMFMTPREIRTHYKPLEGDRQRSQGTRLTRGQPETDEEVWDRKARESKERGLTVSIQRHGVMSPVQLQTASGYRKPQVLGGHHRIAAAPEDSLIPVIHHENFKEAKTDPHNPYEKAAGVGKWKEPRRKGVNSAAATERA